MALHEITLPSANGRDEIQAWLHVPAAEPRGIVQIVHGLGEHSRRYLHVISALVDDGFAVLAGDHAGHGATAMADALTRAITDLPQQLRKTLTWDRGKELAEHARFAFETGTTVFFADPHSPWQRPTNENTNGLLRQYFPKGTDLSRWGADDLAAVAYTLNNRPRKVLNWKTPAEVFTEQLPSAQEPGVATTD